MWSGGRKGAAVLQFLLVVSNWLTLVQAVIESVQVTPSNTSGFLIGELSFLQFLVACALFLQLVAIYANGGLPIEIDLDFANRGGNPNTARDRRADTRCAFFPTLYDSFIVGTKAIKPEGFLTSSGASIVFVDCPLQFVCEMETWANRDHDRFLDRLIASWFRSPNITWKPARGCYVRRHGYLHGMYPCPFDVQEVVGFRIPGSNSLTSAPSSWTGISSDRNLGSSLPSVLGRNITASGDLAIVEITVFERCDNGHFVDNGGE
nr:uncharacterized protein LOC128706429 [Cherax quadricarinatus]